LPATRSTGILLHRQGIAGREVLLVHPGGPFWARKDLGAWSIPKGEVDRDEDPRACALREFEEETGTRLPDETLEKLGAVTLKSGKQVLAYAVAGDLDPADVRSNEFELEWPPRSGRTQAFPEIDRAEWFDLSTARAKLNPAQAEFVDRLEALLATR
jgi:predicted NUDIX family NTP pyrophosphohydrolase